jgi:hypothetical protein
MLMLVAKLIKLRRSQEFLDGICPEDVNSTHWMPFVSRPSREPLQSASGFIPAGEISLRCQIKTI